MIKSPTCRRVMKWTLTRISHYLFCISLQFLKCHKLSFKNWDLKSNSISTYLWSLLPTFLGLTKLKIKSRNLHCFTWHELLDLFHGAFLYFLYAQGRKKSLFTWQITSPCLGWITARMLGWHSKIAMRRSTTRNLRRVCYYRTQSHLNIFPSDLALKHAWKTPRPGCRRTTCARWNIK